MKPIYILPCILGVALAPWAWNSMTSAGTVHGARSLPHGAAGQRSQPPSPDGAFARPAFATPGTPLGDAALAALRAEASTRAERGQARTLFERPSLEGDWLRLLGQEVSATVGLDAAAGRLLADLLIRERDAQIALWEEASVIQDPRGSRELLVQGLRAIAARKRDALVETFGSARAEEVLMLLDDSVPGLAHDPNALASAGD